MQNRENGQPYDLEERTFLFAKRTRLFIKTIPRTLGNREDAKQLVRSSGSIGANYIEANDALSSKDRVMRIKISRKEAKESIYWLRLLDVEPHCEERNALVQEAHELMSILGSILRKLENPGS